MPATPKPCLFATHLQKQKYGASVFQFYGNLSFINTEKDQKSEFDQKKLQDPEGLNTKNGY